MSVMAVQEIKRRGMAAVDAALKDGPVHLIKSNKPQYVVLSEFSYHELMSDLTEARLAASEMDIKSGRVTKGSASDLMHELISN